MNSRIPLPSSLNLWGRERNRRDPFDPFGDRYRRSGDVYSSLYFEDPSIHPRFDPTFYARDHDMLRFDPRMNYQRRRLLEGAGEGRLPPRHGQIDERGGWTRGVDIPRVLDNRRGLQRRSGVFDEYSDPRLKPRSMSQTNDTLPFGRAMILLCRQIDKAYAFYTEFQTEYDSDIQSTKRYATVDILSKLWKLRVIGKHDPGTIEGSDEVIDDETLKFKAKFREMKLKVEKALDAALNSNFKEGEYYSRRSENRKESGKRLKKKVATAREQLVVLLDTASEAPENCRALINELELLKGLINPDLDKNKEMYKSDSDDVTEGTSDTENGYDEG